MNAAAVPLRSDRGQIALGGRVCWRGRVHQVVELCGTSVTLLPQEEGDREGPAPVQGGAGAGQCSLVWLDHLVRSPGFEVLGAPPVQRVFAPLGRLETVDPAVVQAAREWEVHIIEVHTGIHPNAPLGAAAQADFDPATRTLAQRYQAKAAQLQALGWRDASAGTVERKRRAWLKEGLWGLVDDRRTRVRSELGRADPRVVEVLVGLVARARKRRESVGNGARLYERLKTELERRFPQLRVPPPSSFYALLKKLGIAVKDLTAPLRRQGDQDNRPAPPYTATFAQMPGERVEIDTTGLDLLALGEDGLPVSLELTAAIDVATRSILGAVVRPKSNGVRLEPGSTQGPAPKDGQDAGAGGQGRKRRRRRGRATKGVDASLLLAQMLSPHKAAGHWSKLARAENSDLPYELLLESDPRMAGAAARPVITPTMIVIDHGKVFTSRAFLDACAYLGISVRPARVRTPTDKAVIERTFSSLKTLFSQFVAGYTGSDITRRGKGVEKGRLWRIDEINDLLQEFLCLVWQQRPHEGLRNPFHPAMPARTPNQAYAAHVASSGYLPVPLSEADVLHLLPAAWVRVTDKGIRLNRRTYDGAKLNPYRGAPSGLPGRNRMRWEVRYHPYQPETVWLRDHRSNEWVQVDFIYKDLIADPWTERVWEQALDDAQARGQRTDDEQALARAVSKLLRRAARPPARTASALPAAWEESARVPDLEPVDPYANIPPVDPETITARRTLHGDPTGAPAATPQADPADRPASPAPHGAQPGSRTAGPPPSCTLRLPAWVRQAVQSALSAVPASSADGIPDTGRSPAGRDPGATPRLADRSPAARQDT